MEERITIEEVHAKGIDVFGSEDEYQKRLDTENRALNGEKPRKWLLRKDNSIQEIFNILGRIEHGIFA